MMTFQRFRPNALTARCINYQWPDLYGHYREAKFTQTKHHWWWKANVVFDRLRATRDHKGLVVFLEEDHYVAPDFLHILNLMNDAWWEKCPGCDILSLGTYMKRYNYKTDHDKVIDHKTNMQIFENIKYRYSNLLNINDIAHFH